MINGFIDAKIDWPVLTIPPIIWPPSNSGVGVAVGIVIWGSGKLALFYAGGNSTPMPNPTTHFTPAIPNAPIQFGDNQKPQSTLYSPAAGGK